MARHQWISPDQFDFSKIEYDTEEGFQLSPTDDEWWDQNSVKIWVEGQTDVDFWQKHVFVDDQNVCRVRFIDDEHGMELIYKLQEENRLPKEKIHLHSKRVEFMANNESSCIGIKDKDRTRQPTKSNLIQSKYDLETSIYFAYKDKLVQILGQEMFDELTQNCCRLGEIHTWQIHSLELSKRYPNQRRKSLKGLMHEDLRTFDKSAFEPRLDKQKVTLEINIDEGILTVDSIKNICDSLGIRSKPPRIHHNKRRAWVDLPDISLAQDAQEKLNDYTYSNDSKLRVKIKRGKKIEDIENTLKRSNFNPTNDYFNGHHLEILFEFATEKNPNCTKVRAERFVDTVLDKTPSSQIIKLQPVKDVINYVEGKSWNRIIRRELNFTKYEVRPLPPITCTSCGSRDNVCTCNDSQFNEAGEQE